ncbi:MAG TPA: glycosyltransferase family 4 protein [Mucilaginibacter sp.]|jgi:glycosyltransferase involved in cell wall biosynthesis
MSNIAFSDKPIKLIRITTVPHSLDLLLRGQMRYMKSNNIQVIMMCSNGPEISGLIEREGCDWIEVPLTRKFNIWKDFKALIFLVNQFRKIKPDIVHSHSPKAGTVAQLAAKITGVPLRIHTIAGLPLMEYAGKKRILLNYVERLTYYCSHWILPNSKSQAKFIIEEKFTDPKKIHIIGQGSSNGIDRNYYSKTKDVLQQAKSLMEELNLTCDDFKICFVGRLANSKGINELVYAYKKLEHLIPNLKLLLVGPYEDINPLDHDVLETINSNDNIITSGHVNDIRPYLASADLFVFPSYREGFPQSLMQANAMGLPCIATDINGCNEIIEHNVNGILIKPKNIDELIASVLHLYRNPDERNMMSKNAISLITKEFDQQYIWSELLLFYKSHLN